MTEKQSIEFTRRRSLTLGAGLAAAPWIEPAAVPLVRAAEPSAAASARLVATPGTAPLRGDRAAPTQAWGYDGTIPGPVLRLPQAVPLRAVVENRLAEATTVHWHGVRVPNAMDGVPGLTQPPIAPEGTFTYAFSPPDAGTFWYHSHADSAEQLGRGLAGALIVAEADPPVADHDLLWVIQDWRLLPDGQLAPGFLRPMEAAMSGHVGNTVTINGEVRDRIVVRAGERVRLRLANAAMARIMALRFAGHRPIVIALDGQPCEPHEPADGRIVLGPAMRADLILDMSGEAGREYPVTDDFYDGLSYTLVRLAYDRQAPVRAQPLPPPARLPPNPVPLPDLAAAERHTLRLQGGMNGTMRIASDSHAVWAINDMAMTGDGEAGMKPSLTLAHGRSCILDLRNETAWWHPMHLHGHSFRILARNGAAVPHDQWGDTVLVHPQETVTVAFVADNPGDWMFHCHVLGHQLTGLMTVLRVA